VTNETDKKMIDDFVAGWPGYKKQWEPVRRLSRRQKAQQALALMNGPLKTPFDSMTANLDNLVKS
jgi:hypothetical protein